MHKLWQQLAIASNWPVLASVLVLSLLGLVSIWVDDPSNGHSDGPRQLLFIFVAIAAMGAVQTLNYQLLGRFAWAFYFLSLGLIAYTLAGAVAEAHGHPLPGIHTTNQAACWISFPGFKLEPSELMKVSFILVLARYLRYRKNYRSLPGLIPPFAIALAPILLIFKQPDLGVAALFVPVLFIMLFVAGAKLRHLAVIVLAALVLIPILWLSGDEDLPVFRHLPTFIHAYQRDRVRSIFSKDPKDLRQTGFQQQIALQAIGSGGPTGKGIGEIPVGQHIPEAHNDMIFALIGEQFGLIGSLAVLIAYIVLFAAGIEIAATTREPFGRLVAVGIVSILAAQSLLNLAVCMRLFPVTGVTLPFVSYGGSSLVASYIAAALLLNIGQTRPLVIARDSFEFD